MKQMIAYLLLFSNICQASYVIPDNGVTTRKIANQNVTAAKIANATITGTQVAPNINLPGSATNSNGANLVVSNFNAASNLAILRVAFNAAGALTLGEGATVTVHSFTGLYTVAFTNAFVDVPVVVITPFNTSVAQIAPVVSAISQSGLNVNFFSGGTAVNTDFFIIAIGRR